MTVVHVACKIPSGIVLGGVDQVKVSGSAYEVVPGQMPPARPGGYAITLNIDERTWLDWLSANAASAMVLRSLIFADSDLAALTAKAKSLGMVRSGLEPR